jgi:hypothetical protein
MSFVHIALIVMVQQAFFKYIFKPCDYPVGSKHVQFLREHKLFLIVKWLCCTALFIISLLKHNGMSSIRILRTR